MLHRLRRIATKLSQRLVILIAFLASLTRWRSSYVVDRHVGVGDGPLSGKVCVFVHFDRKGEVHDYVLYYLGCLRQAGFRIVFVSNAPRLKPESVAAVSAIAQLVLRRRRAGGTFGAYKDGIAAIDDLSQVDLLLLADDSVYGPFLPLDGVVARMTALPGQFWSLTDSWRWAYHLDTDFILFGREAIASPAFARFWSNVRYVDSLEYQFQHYSVGLSQKLTRAGLRGTALCSHRDIAHVVIEAVRDGGLNANSVSDDKKLDERRTYLKNAYEHVQQGQPFDFAPYLWDYLIVRMRYPFIRRALFQRDRVHAPYISYWQDVVADESDYDPDLIVRHLETTLKNRFT